MLRGTQRIQLSFLEKLSVVVKRWWEIIVNYVLKQLKKHRGITMLGVLTLFIITFGKIFLWAIAVLFALALVSFILFFLPLKEIQKKDERGRDTTIWWIVVRPLVAVSSYFFVKFGNRFLDFLTED
ncbi:MAG: hypothetical protein WCW93_01600 [Candidatus Paceibacterota bacterium]